MSQVFFLLLPLSLLRVRPSPRAEPCERFLFSFQYVFLNDRKSRSLPRVGRPQCAQVACSGCCCCCFVPCGVGVSATGAPVEVGGREKTQKCGGRSVWDSAELFVFVCLMRRAEWGISE